MGSCMVMLFFIIVGGLYWGIQWVAEGDGNYWIQDKCYVSNRVRDYSCSHEALSKDRYFATSDYCGLNVTLESHYDETECGDQQMQINKEYDCFFKGDACDDKVFWFERTGENHTIGMILIAVSCAAMVAFCVILSMCGRDFDGFEC